MSDFQNHHSALIYQSETGAITLSPDTNLETLWATQKQMAQLFDVQVHTLNEHLKNILSSGELDESTIRNFRIVQIEGTREVTREVIHYNLDMIISVGYRINSKYATHFRKWATGVLKDHITNGYTINQELLNTRKTLAQKAIENIRLLSDNSTLITKDTVLDLIDSFTHTWFSLQRYDTDTLPQKGKISKSIEISAAELYADVATLKQSLMAQGEATALFAQEKTQLSLEGILGNVMQNVFGEEVYPTNVQRHFALSGFYKNMIFLW